MISEILQYVPVVVLPVVGLDFELVVPGAANYAQFAWIRWFRDSLTDGAADGTEAIVG